MRPTGEEVKKKRERERKKKSVNKRNKNEWKSRMGGYEEKFAFDFVLGLIRLSPRM